MLCFNCSLLFTVAFYTNDFGASNGPIGLTDVSCEDGGDFLFNCSFNVNTQQLSHAGDIGVKCFNETGTVIVFFIIRLY